MNRIMNRIRELRFVNGEMTRAELAARVGVTRQTVIAMERGKYSPSLDVAFRTPDVPGAPLTDVFQYNKSDGSDI